MTERSFPFAGQNEAPEDDYYRLHRRTGVLSGLGITFNGLTYSLTVGEAYVGGSMYLNETTPATGASQPTTAANPRRDMLVLRRTLTADGATSSTVRAIRQGSPATTPVDPTPTQQVTGVFEEPLWSWLVPGNGSNVVTDIRDLRLPAVDSGGTISKHTGTWYPLQPASDFATSGKRVWGRENEALAELIIPSRRRPYRVRAQASFEGGSTNANTRWDATVRLGSVTGTVLGVYRGGRWLTDARGDTNDLQQYPISTIDSDVLSGEQKLYVAVNTGYRPTVSGAPAPSLGVITPALREFTAVAIAA